MARARARAHLWLRRREQRSPLSTRSGGLAIVLSLDPPLERSWNVYAESFAWSSMTNYIKYRLINETLRADTGDRQTHSRSSLQTYRQTDRQTDRHTQTMEKQTNKRWSLEANNTIRLRYRWICEDDTTNDNYDRYLLLVFHCLCHV